MKILSFLAGLILSLFPAPQPANYGATVPTTPALIDTYLSAGIASTDTSLTLANGLTRAGTALSGTICLTLDANTPSVEYVCGTASSTSVTGLSRGIDPLNPNATSSALAYSHRRFASAQITDYPTIAYLVRNANGVDAYTNPLFYSSGAASFITSSTQLASKGYVDTQVLAGGAPASASVGGLVMIATTASTTQGVATSSAATSTYTLVPANSLFNATSSATNLVPVTGSNGKLSQGFLDLTQPFTFSGGLTSSGTTTLSSTTTFSGATTFNASTTFTATTTITGTLVLATTTQVAHTVFFTTSTTWTVPAGVTTIYFDLIAGGGGGGGGNINSHNGGGGGSGGYVLDNTTTTVPGQIISITVGTAGQAGAANGGNGTAGGNSSLGGVTANGGGAGLGASSSAAGSDGAGGSPNGTTASAGTGASSIFGVGVALGNPPAAVAANYHAAGGGGGQGSGGSGSAGGNGAPGLVVIRY